MQQKQKRNAWVHVYICACVLVIVCRHYSLTCFNNVLKFSLSLGGL